MSDVPAGSSGPAGDERVAAQAWWVNYERSASLARAPVIGDTTAEPAPSIDVDAVTARILSSADRCAECRAEMDAFVAPYAERGRAAAAVLHPAFRELVSRFASAFTVLTELVDPLQVAGLPWEGLIADEKLLAGLRAGAARAAELVRNRALVAHLAEQNEAPAA